MTRRLVFQHPDLTAYLDRQARLWDALHGKSITLEAIASIQREADVIPWQVGHWYEIRVFAGQPTERTVRGHDETGAFHELVLADVKDLRWVDLTVMPLRRMSVVVAGVVPSMLFEMPGGERALMHDMDIWSAYEVDRSLDRGQE